MKTSRRTRDTTKDNGKEHRMTTPWKQDKGAEETSGQTGPLSKIAQISRRELTQLRLVSGDYSKKLSPALTDRPSQVIKACRTNQRLVRNQGNLVQLKPHGEKGVPGC